MGLDSSIAACVRCGYCLAQLSISDDHELTCPECGQRQTLAEAAADRSAPLPYKVIVAFWPALLTACLGLISGATGYLREPLLTLSMVLDFEIIPWYVSVPHIVLWALTVVIVCASHRIRHRNLGRSWSILLVVGLPVNAVSMYIGVLLMLLPTPELFFQLTPSW